MVEINNQTKQKINELKIRRLAAKFLKVYHKTNVEVSVALVSALTIKKLNYQYRKINQATDILSFPGQTKKYLGEIIINPAAAKRTGQALEREGLLLKKTGQRQPAYVLYFLIVHGLLHLVGYDDQSAPARQKMLALGKKFLDNNV